VNLSNRDSASIQHGRIKIQNTEAVVEMGSELLTRVPDGEEKKIELPDQKFEIKEYGEPIEQEVKRPGVNEMTTVYPEIGTKTVILQPELSIRNNGELNIVGHARGMVLPNINEPPVRSIVASNRANKQTKMELTKEKSVVFMEKDPNYRGQFDRGGCN